ncbi:MAG: hypothetical protein SNJ82_09070 [Gemmataceae bacterium]
MVTDGPSHTLLVGERPPTQFGDYGRWIGNWGSLANAANILGVAENENYQRDPMCPAGPYSFQRGKIDDDCSRFHF